MNHTHYNLGALKKGSVVEVILEGSAANVYLLDTLNYKKYTKRERFMGVGGYQKSSPVRLQAPATAQWHVAVDLPAGSKGTVKSSYRLLTTAGAAGDSKIQLF